MHPATDITWLKVECEKATSFEELVVVALGELKKFKDGAELVCGPITTGGQGSVEANLAVFNKVIDHFVRVDRPIFSQMPYEGKIFLLRREWINKDPNRANEYYHGILERFYLPLIESGLIRTAWFIEGWESSVGAKWEHKQLRMVGAHLRYLNNLHLASILEE